MRSKVVDFSRYSSLRIGAPCEVSLITDSKDAQEAQNLSLRIIGKANNLLISPTARNLAMLDKNLAYIKPCDEDPSLLEVGGAYSSGRIFSYFKAHNLSGVEFLQALPGSLGGLIKMNAGMKAHEIKSALHSINVNGVWQGVEAYPMRYRDSGISGVILAARFHKREGFDSALVKACNALRRTHPHEPSCGSCFKNPPGDFAGRLLETAGLKGHSIGDVALSEKHANFLVNKGRARFDDAIALIELAKKRVFEQSGIRLECEVQILF